MKTALRAGLIFAIAHDVGLELFGRGDKRALRCPFHDDRHASAFVSLSNVFFCAVCTPDGGWPAKRLCAELGLDWGRYVTSTTSLPATRRIKPERAVATFSPADASRVWKAARVRARDDEAIGAEAPTYRYLAQRRLEEAIELGIVGILPQAEGLPEGVSRWPSSGHKLVSPLFDLSGTLVSLQARRVGNHRPKVLTPAGAPCARTLFANPRGLELLRDPAVDGGTVILGEGLTDHLALTIAAAAPVLAVPGVSNAVEGIGEWVKGRCLVIALDCNDAGERVVSAVARAAYQGGARRVRRIVWPDRAEDACEALEQLGASGLAEFLEGQLPGGTQ